MHFSVTGNVTSHHPGLKLDKTQNKTKLFLKQKF